MLEMDKVTMTWCHQQSIPLSPVCAEQLLIWDNPSSSCLVGYTDAC